MVLGGVCMCVRERGINLKFCILSSVSHTQLICQHHGVHLPAHLPDCSLESPGYTRGPAHGCEHEAEFKNKLLLPNYKWHKSLLGRHLV